MQTTLLLLAIGCSDPPARADLTRTVDASPPRVFVARDSMSTRQGGTLSVWIRTDEAARVAVSFLGRERPVFEVGDQQWRVLVGIPIRAEAGDSPLQIEAIDAWGNQTSATVQVSVEAVEWPKTGKLPMSRAKARVEPEAVKQMREERDAVYRTASEEPLWSGPMRIPVDGGVHTSAYGSFREYPDGSRNHHDAEDIARRRGVPILAAADGVVALAKRQEMHGNAVLVDHGHKVISLYSHLQRIDVEVGQPVRAGDLLGSMGSTGRTTGPHLHWGVVVDEVAIDPMVWTEEDFREPHGAAFFEVSADLDL